MLEPIYDDCEFSAETLALMLSAVKKRELGILADDYGALESVSMVLQTDSRNGHINTAAGRAMFDELVGDYPTMRHHPAADADIVDNKDFDTGIMKIQRGMERTLTPA
jgi:hypothetical protein